MKQEGICGCAIRRRGWLLPALILLYLLITWGCRNALLPIAAEHAPEDKDVSVVDLFVSGLIRGNQGALSSLGLIVRQGTNNIASSNILVAYGNGTVVAVQQTNGPDINLSTDGGKTFGTDISNNFTTTPKDVQYGNGVFLITATDGELSRSTDDGATWSALISNPFVAGVDDINSAAYDSDNDVWVIVGQATPYVARSTDGGATWTAASSTPATGITMKWVAYAGNGIFVATGGDPGEVWRSTDSGDTWTQVTGIDGQIAFCYEVEYGDGVLILHVGRTGGDTALFRSTDAGVTWSKVVEYGSAPLLYHAGYAAGIWFCGDQASLDGGVTWSTSINGHPLSFPASITSIAYDPVQRVLSIGAGAGLTYYSEWLEAGAGIVTQGATTNHLTTPGGEYAIWSSGRIEMTVWGFVTGDGANWYELDSDKTLPYASVTSIESVQCTLVGYKTGSDPGTRWDRSGLIATEVISGGYDGTNLDIRVSNPDGATALISGTRYIWIAHLIGTV